LASKEIMANEKTDTLVIDSQKLYDATEYLLARAKELGADNADCTCDMAQNLEIAVRMGGLENVERSETIAAGLRVMIGKKQAGATTSSLSKDSLDILAQRVVAMAKLASVDPYCTIADSDLICKNPVDLRLIDTTKPDIAHLEQLALEAEESALSIPKIENIASCGASWSYHHTVYGASNGFLGGYGATNWGLFVAPMAMENDLRQRDYDYSTTRFIKDLKSAKEIGKYAGERTARRLNPRKITTQNAPIVIENRVAKNLIGVLIGAITGTSITRGISFLKDRLGQQIFADNINITENPLLLGGLGSRPFDGEGITTYSKAIIENGVLNNWLLNSSTALQLGLKSTANASFAQGGPHGIGIGNILVNPSQNSREDLIKMANNGLYVSEAMAPNYNPNSGDYSVGVSGYIIENGQLSHSVSEITIAANFNDIFKTMIFGNDLDYNSSTICPSVLIPNMSIAGE
jgi:PmbA protein